MTPAYRTINDVATLVGIPPHVLRFWETKFPQITPLKRGGGRRYYRPEDVAVIERVARLLHGDGYTIKGAQKLIAAEFADPVPGAAPAASTPRETAPQAISQASRAIDPAAVAVIRADLAAALAAVRAMP